jgi:hypothetical protein
MNIKLYGDSVTRIAIGSISKTSLVELNCSIVVNGVTKVDNILVINTEGVIEIILLHSILSDSLATDTSGMSYSVSLDELDSDIILLKIDFTNKGFNGILNIYNIKHITR